MKKRICSLILCTLLFASSLLLLTGCKRSPAGMKVSVVSYPKNGMTYTKEINAFSFYDQFREESVTVSFTDERFLLQYEDKIFEGTWQEEKESKQYATKQGATFFSMSDGNGNTGTGFSGAWGDIGSNGLKGTLGFWYIGGSFCFGENAGNVRREGEYSQEEELAAECELLNECLSSGEKTYGTNEKSYYETHYCSYELCEITKKDNFFYLSNASEERLPLGFGFYYDFDGTAIRYSDSIREGKCILKKMNGISYFAVFYLPEETK